MERKSLKIGVISDTHGALKPGVTDAFKGVDLILHAGDIGNLDIIYSLMEIAPVQAVYGNMDSYVVMKETREKVVIPAMGRVIGLAHGGGSPVDIIQRLENQFRNDNVDVIVFGHTHSPTREKRGKILFFNPGDGRKTVGIIEIFETGGIETQIIDL
jgi:uncharacterized protein